MKRNIKIKILESCACHNAAPCPDNPGAAVLKALDKMPSQGKHKHDMPNAHNGQEARLHRTTLAHLMADVKVLLDFIEDEDDLPEWVEAKITKAGDYMNSVARYIAGNIAREEGQL